MVKKQKVYTAEELFQMELNNEAELGRAQRQQRLLERSRSGFSSGPKFVRQQKLMGILQKEKNNIDTDLLVATCSTKKKQDLIVNFELQDLIEENDCSEILIKEKKAHLVEINGQIDLVKKKLIKLRAQTTTEVQHQLRIAAGRNAVAGLENKLETATKRFCTISTENRQLRDEISHLLLARIEFNKLWELLIQNLKKGKAFMMDLIEQSSVAYNQRDEWCTRLQALRTRALSDLVLQTQEMNHLQRARDHDSKAQEFFIIKGRRRAMKGLEKKEKEKRSLRRDLMETILESHNDILNRIFNFANAKDAEVVETGYYKTESENFAMLNCINDLHTDIEGLTQTLTDTYSEIGVHKETHKLREERQKDNIANLKADLARLTKEADAELAAFNKDKQKLGFLYDGINKLCGIVKCSYEYNTFFALLGENVQVNDFNVHLYLGLLEKTVAHLMADVYLKEKQTPRRIAAPPRGTPIPQPVINETLIALPVNRIERIVRTNPCPLCVEQEQVSDLIDTLQFVQTREEVALKLEHRLRLPDGLDRLHNVSACHLPKSRQIIQKRYQ